MSKILLIILQKNRDLSNVLCAFIIHYRVFQHTRFLFLLTFQYSHQYSQHICHHLSLFFYNEHLQVAKVLLLLEQYFIRYSAIPTSSQDKRAHCRTFIVTLSYNSKLLHAFHLAYRLKVIVFLLELSFKKPCSFLFAQF